MSTVPPEAAVSSKVNDCLSSGMLSSPVYVTKSKKVLVYIYIYVVHYI